MKVVNIYGCCVCRDIFRITPCEDKYRVAKFVQGINPISAYNTKGQRITVEDLSSLSNTNFAKRNFTLNINGTAIDYLKEEIADYFIFDLADFRLESNKLTFQDGTTKIVTRIQKNLENLLIEFGIKVDKDIVTDEKDIYESIDKLIETLNEDYKSSQIILIENYLVDRHIDDISNYIRECNTSFIKQKNTELKKYYDYVLKRMPNINVIKMPDYTFGNARHTWGFDSLHFIDDYYKYLFKAFEIIVDNPKDKQEKLDELRKHYSNYFESLLANKRKEYFLAEEKNENILTNPKLESIDDPNFGWILKCSKESSYNKETHILKTGNDSNPYAIILQEIDIDKIKGRPFNLSVKYKSSVDSVFNIVLRYKEKVAGGGLDDYKMVFAFPKPLISNGFVKVDNIVNIFPSNVDNIKDVEVALYLNKPNMEAEILEADLRLFNINSPLF